MMKITFVTILVFLAALLQLEDSIEYTAKWFGYNPCFSGSSIATNSDTVLDIVLSQLQSLFFWQLYCNSKQRDISMFRSWSYNPCFSGSSIATLVKVFAKGVYGFEVTILVFLAALLQLLKNS